MNCETRQVGKDPTSVTRENMEIFSLTTVEGESDWIESITDCGNGGIVISYVINIHQVYSYFPSHIPSVVHHPIILSLPSLMTTNAQTPIRSPKAYYRSEPNV